MRVRALDTNHDWTFGKGRNNYLTGVLAVAQNIDTRLNSFLGDCFFDLTAGIDWFNLCSSKDTVALNLAVSAVILNTANVTGIKQLSLVLTPSRRITIRYQVNTTYSTLTSTFEFDQSTLG